MPVDRTRVIDTSSSARDHVWFVAIYLVGAILVFVLRLLFNLPMLIVSAVLILLVIFYMYYVRRNRYRLREDRAADNVYYLGFLYTVTTLGVSLLRYQISSDPQVSQIIGDLGLGLFTTVAGLLGRIFLGQLRQDPEEIEERARFMLADAVEETRAGLIGMNEEIARIHAHAVQTTKENWDLLSTTSKDISLAAKKLEASLADINIPDDFLQSLFQPLLTQLAESVDDVSSRLKGIQINSNLLGEAVGELFDPLQGPVATLNQGIVQTNESITKLVAQNENIASFSKNADKLVDNHERLVRWYDEIEANQKKLGLMNESLQKSIDAVGKLHSSLQHIDKELASSQAQYGESASTIIGSMGKMQTQLEEMSNLIQRLGKEFSAAMQKLAKRAGQTTRD